MYVLSAYVSLNFIKKIVEILLETGAVEIICSEKEANLLVEITKSESVKLSILLAILAILL